MKIVSFLKRIVERTEKWPTSFPKNFVVNFLETMEADISNFNESKKIREYVKKIKQIDQIAILKKDRPDGYIKIVEALKQIGGI